MPSAGGDAKPVTALDASLGETSHRDPSLLRDGRQFLYRAVSTTPDNNAVYVGTFDSQDRRRLFAADSKVVFVPPDRLLFVRGGNLMSQRFDTDDLVTVGDASLVAAQVPVNASRAAFSAVPGILAYRKAPPSQLLWFDRAGRQIGSVEQPRHYATPVLSPDGNRVATETDRDIWIIEIAVGSRSRLTTDPGTDTAPWWLPDGERLVFQSNRSGRVDLFVANVGVPGSEQLLVSSDYPKFPESVSRDSRYLLYSESRGTNMDLWAVSLTGNRTAIPVVRSPFLDAHGRFSPDGNWMAFVSLDRGRPEVYVQRFPSGRKWPISIDGGSQPVWTSNGGELLFMSGTGEIMAVELTLRLPDSVAVGKPQLLFKANPVSAFGGRNNWDASADGQRLLINSAGPQALGAPITVVFNWLR